jgi:hypothetical protein
MFDRVIIAFGDLKTKRAWREIADMLGAEYWPGRKAEMCRDAAHVRQVRRYCAGAKDLVILGRDLPADAEDPDAQAGELGAAVDLLGEIQKEQSPAACVLVGPTDNQVTKVSAAWPLFSSILQADPRTSDMAGSLEAVAKGLAARRDRGGEPAAPGAPVVAGATWALLDVNLDGSQRSRLRLQIGAGHRLEEPRESPLSLDEAELDEVVKLSRELRQKMNEHLRDKNLWLNYVSLWRNDYENVGRKIFALINKYPFDEYMGRALQAANENARLRFVLHEKAYDGLWEAMFHPHRREWMMLSSTITRRTQSQAPGPLRRLDGGDGTVHVLAIGSNVPDGAKAKGPNNAGWQDFWKNFYEPKAVAYHRVNRDRMPLNIVFPPLKEIASELQELAKLRDAVNKRHKAKLDLEVEDGATAGKSLFARVREQLLAGPRPGGSARFDVVHFAGHALFNDQDMDKERGYLVFGGSPETDFVPISEFAFWLKQAGVQMVYLSCCRSSAARAAFELANAGIPLAIGFTWDLDSALAAEFAKAFYEALFRNDLKVCRAFQQARVEIANGMQNDDPIWASPVLVAQPSDWTSVESYMGATG